MAATINVTYTNFSVDAQAAFEAAKTTWEGLLNSTVEIRINATFRTTDLPGSLCGMCVPNGVLNGPNATPNTWYVSALADALAGADQQAGEFDMDIQFSPNYPWYFGRDGHPGNQELDFVTVALHEICHGLGFVGLCNADPTGGSYSRITALQVNYFFTPSFPFPNLQGEPSIYYRNCLLTQPAPQLTNVLDFPNPSLNLKGVFTRGYGPVYVCQELAPYKIYTPPVFAFGSSMDHLSDNTSLMYYSIGLNAIHAPDPVVLDILNQLGWANTAP